MEKEREGHCAAEQRLWNQRQRRDNGITGQAAVVAEVREEGQTATTR